MPDLYILAGKMEEDGRKDFSFSAGFFFRGFV